jgi:UDP-glucose 4-epimerase
VKVLVTGGHGFIGRHVCNVLVAQGHEPLVFDRKRNLALLNAVFGDIRDSTHVTDAMACVDGFIHLAGILGTQETVQNPRPAAETNILGSLNVLEAAAQYKVPGVCIGVGNHWMQNPYSITKSTVERFVAMYNKERGTKLNIVRPVNAYGPGQSAPKPYGSSSVRKITPSFVCRALHDDPIEVYGDGNQVSDMVYVEDVATSIVRALRLAAQGTILPAIEVGPLEHNSVREIAEIVIELTGSKSKIVNLPMRPGEAPGESVTANVESMKAAGINPEDFTKIRDGLQKTVDYYRRSIRRAA